MTAEQETEAQRIAVAWTSIPQDSDAAVSVHPHVLVLSRAYLALEAELQAAQGLLLECHGWMNGVEPKPAQPFLDAVLAAAQRTEEPSE